MDTSIFFFYCFFFYKQGEEVEEEEVEVEEEVAEVEELDLKSAEEEEKERRRTSVEEAARASSERRMIRTASQERLFAPFYAGSMSPSARWRVNKEKEETTREAQRVLDSLLSAEKILEEEEEESGVNAYPMYYVLNDLNEVEGPYKRGKLILRRWSFVRCFVGCCWLLLVVIGCWLLLSVVVGCCRRLW